jgi:hypothetical protein
MPTSFEILNGLAAISNEGISVAVFWHIVFGLIIVALVLGWRPSRRVAAIALALPLLSVSIFAWKYDNPFNGTVFLLSAILLANFGFRLSGDKVRPGAVWGSVAGALLMVFGWIYPHFLITTTWLKYFYAAPTGLVPCPTLSLIIGLALLANGFASRAWPTASAILGIFYGLFGALRLGVHIDFFLLAGALLLLIQTIVAKPRHLIKKS